MKAFFGKATEGCGASTALENVDKRATSGSRVYVGGARAICHAVLIMSELPGQVFALHSMKSNLRDTC